jgi:hypothetical protein
MHAIHGCLQVPSGYFLTDVFLDFDRQMQANVFKPDRSKLKESKMSLASNEAVIMKKLVGALRSLWRSSQEKGCDEKVTELKGYVLPSPLRRAQQPEGEAEISEHEEGGAVALPDAELGEGEEEDLESGAGNPELDGEPVSENDGESESGDEAQASSSQDTPEEGSLEHAPADQAAAGDADEEMESDDSVINAPTLVLGSPSTVSTSDSEDPEFQCSQVSSGWMGRAIMAGNAIDREEKEKEGRLKRKQFEQDRLEFLVDDVRAQLEYQLNENLEGTCLWEGYKKFCMDAFTNRPFELHQFVWEHLVKLDTYQDWIHDAKSSVEDLVGGKGG